MKKLPIDFEDLAAAMEDHSGYGEHYLDIETGEVVTLPPELQHLDLWDQGEIGDLPAWEQEMVPLARAIEEGSERYVPVLQIPSYEVYNLMVAFAESVPDPELSRLLSVALRGKGAFGRFKGILMDHPAEQDRWFAMKEAAMAGWIREWLHGLGIEPVAGREGP